MRQSTESEQSNTESKKKYVEPTDEEYAKMGITVSHEPFTFSGFTSAPKPTKKTLETDGEQDGEKPKAQKDEE